MIEKPAETRVPVHALIQRRWSPRAFADRAVTPATLTALFEAARWAPSAFNEQPWRYIVAVREDAAAYEKLLGCLVEWNQNWAKTAPVLAISVARGSFTRNDRPNAHAFHDTGMASMSLVTEAMNHGLMAHQMGGFDADRARDTYGIPEGFDPVAAIAIGYPTGPDVLDESYHEDERAPRTRRPLEETVFGDGWETPFGRLADR